MKGKFQIVILKGFENFDLTNTYAFTLYSLSAMCMCGNCVEAQMIAFDTV